MTNCQGECEAMGDSSKNDAGLGGAPLFEVEGVTIMQGDLAIAACYNPMNPSRIGRTPTAELAKTHAAHIAECLNSHYALRAQRDELAAALREADRVLATFQDDAVCDHSVGICWCDFNRTREVNRALLLKVAP